MLKAFLCSLAGFIGLLALSTDLHTGELFFKSGTATSSTAAKPKVAKVEQVLKVYDANGSTIFSASVQTGTSGERIATVTTSDKEFQQALPAFQTCVQMPDVQDCVSLEECLLAGNKECYDAFIAQNCERSPSMRKGCMAMLRVCLRDGGYACQWYVEDDCLGPSK